MEKTKKNNKGFSLVELIVVVLIMAIIAVSLAPQVMKWVENSRIATDVSNYDSLISNCQLALTDANAYSEMKASEGYTLTIKSSGTVTLAANKSGGATTAMDAALDLLDASWINLNVKASGVSEYVITIDANGTVKRGDASGNKVPDASAVK